MKNEGYTLIELILVMVIIAILAGVAVQSMISSVNNDRLDITADEMDMIARSIAGDDRLISSGIRTDFGYVGDIGSLPPNLDALMTNPGGYATWKGPYVRNDFNEDVNGFKNDAWNNPYIYSGGVTIQSTCDGTPITKQFANSVADLTSNTVTGFVKDKTGAPPGDSAANVTVTIFYPNGSGSMTSSSVSPSRTGEFSIPFTVPIGIHRIQGIVTGANDTTSKYVAVYPASVSLADLKFPSSLWGATSGGGAAGITLVAGSQQFDGGNCDGIQFDITNSGSSPIDITSLTLTWSSPTAYYRRIRYNNAIVFQANNPRQGSGEISSLTSMQTIQPGEIVTIRIQDFVDQPSGGIQVNMRNTVFTVDFSDGSTFDVAMGDCIG